MNGSNAIAMHNISKRFPGVLALDHVSFEVKTGEVHALIGENGAGKSTLMKILGGVYLPDEGYIEIDGKRAEIHSPIDSIRRGISIIYQELNLVPTLTVSENIFLGKELKKNGQIDRKSMLEKSQNIIDSLGFESLNAAMRVEQLSVAQQQIVEISKALLNDSNVVVMDEPTAVLTGKESEILFDTIERLKAGGVSIIYISHRLEEIVRLSDRITVLRDGQFIVELDNKNKDTSVDDMVNYMVGRELNTYYPQRKKYQGGEVVVDVRGLSKKGMFQNISFQVHKGEILGFFGLVGAGRTELMKTLYGEFQADLGEVYLNGKRICAKNPHDAVANGLALVPEDRKMEGLVLAHSMAENIALPNSRLIKHRGCSSERKKAELANKYIQDLDIRPPYVNRPSRDFSGGNQQKIVISKWLAANPKVIIMDEPTRGIDVYAKKEIYELINEMTDKGISVIVVSSEMTEVMGICDRILVMYEGKITAEYKEVPLLTQERIMASASGL